MDIQKIAILTFQDAINYGAALQAYALKTVMDKHGECHVINYFNESFYPKYNNQGLKRKLIFMINNGYWEKKQRRFEFFQNKYIVDDDIKIKTDQLINLNDKFDIFITGSDQVWNMQCSGYKTAYFLDFVLDDNKKFSYAASFGSDMIEDTKQIKGLLEKFNAISVREKSGKELVEQLVQKKATVVLDPTLLLTLEHWKKSFNLRFDNKYVLVYEVLNGTKLFEKAKQFAKKQKLPLVCITSSNKLKIGSRCIKDAGPIEWMRILAESAYIFTNSFHGLAFSLIFEKQFFIELLPEPSKTNARLIELLSSLGLCNRILQGNTVFKVGDNIDYISVKDKLDRMRKESFQYIDLITKEIH